MQRLIIKDGNLTIVDDSYQEATMPVVENYATNRFSIKLINKNVADMNVAIYDRTGEIVYTGYLSNASRFNLDKLPAGEYRFEFGIANASFTKYVKVK